MANWCNNFVIFTGSEENMKKVNELFAEMAKFNIKTNTGAKPDFIEYPKQDWFFDIMPETNNDGFFNYLTKWSPNYLDLIKIADKFDLDFECEYSECGNGIFGKCFYKNALFTDYSLEYDEYIQAVPVDEDNDEQGYIYEGEHYEVLEEALELILEEKIKLATI